MTISVPAAPVRQPAANGKAPAGKVESTFFFS